MDKGVLCTGECWEWTRDGGRGCVWEEGRLDWGLHEQQLSLEVLQPREDADVGGDEPGAFQDSTEATVAGVW